MGNNKTKFLKEKVHKKFKNTCQLCQTEINGFNRNLFLTVHHIDYNKENNCEENLISLCQICNSKMNKERKNWEEYWNEKITCGN